MTCLMLLVQIAHQPSIYVLDTPGVLVPSIPDIETGLKLALAGIHLMVCVPFFAMVSLSYPGKLPFEGSVKDSVVGEQRIAQYLLAVLNVRGTPFHWKHSNNRRMEGIRYESEEKREYNPKDLRPNRRKPPNASDLLYIEVMSNISYS